MRAALFSIAVSVSLIASAAPARGQESTVTAKDPAIALGFAWLCPGCGHLYSGETTKGALIAAVSLGAITTGIAIQFLRSLDLMTNMHECGFDDPRSDCLQPGTNFTPILVGGAIALAGYVYGLIDAGASARRMNAKHGLDFGGIDVKPALARDGSVRAEFRIPLPVHR
jgi:hypothetical protein